MYILYRRWVHTLSRVTGVRPSAVRRSGDCAFDSVWFTRECYAVTSGRESPILTVKRCSIVVVGLQ